MASSWEDARRCPADGDPGEIVGKRPAGPKENAPAGSQLITLECKNTRCQYHDTPWVVMINPDGTIPDPLRPGEREKQFHDTSNFTSRQRARDVVAQLTEEVARSQKPGAEVRNPYR